VDVHLAFTNDGAADAMKIRMSGVTTIAKNSFRGPLTRKGMTSNEVPMEVSVGRTMTATLREPQRWAKEGVAAIESGEVLLLHFGRVDYTDPIGNSYWLEYCLRYEPGMPLSPSGLHYMALADKQFWPQDDGDEHNADLRPK
jgi:hypothetical protein